MEDKIIEENTEIIGTMNITEAEVSQEKVKKITVTIRIEVPVIVDQGQDLKLVLTEIG